MFYSAFWCKFLSVISLMLFIIFDFVFISDNLLHYHLFCFCGILNMFFFCCQNLYVRVKPDDFYLFSIFYLLKLKTDSFKASLPILEFSFTHDCVDFKFLKFLTSMISLYFPRLIHVFSQCLSMARRAAHVNYISLINALFVFCYA